jgi:glycosyltransferase involved in cell wall biosynthesis
VALAASARANEEVVLFSASWRDRLDAAVTPPLPSVDRKIPVRLLNYAWHRLEWPPVEALTGRRFDVVHSLHPLLIPSRRAARVVTVHDLDFLDHPERTRAEIRRDYPELAALHVAAADHIVVNSAHTGREVAERFNIALSRMTVCMPGAPEWAPRTSLPGRDGCLLFVGTLESRKNLGVLLDAYARLRESDATTPRLVLAGRIDDAARPLLDRIGRRPLAGHVDLPGYVSEADKRELYNRALVFVMPSHTEGFGLPVLEALKAGVPVVAANRGALPETVGAAGALFEPDSADQLFDLLRGILTSPARQQQMADAGLAHAAQFTWRHTADRLREAWALAVEGRKSRG